LSTGKKFPFPIFSLSGQIIVARVFGFAARNSNPSFRLLIPDRCGCIHSEAIRSVTHLVLALYGKECR